MPTVLCEMGDAALYLATNTNSAAFPLASISYSWYLEHNTSNIHAAYIKQIAWTQRTGDFACAPALAVCWQRSGAAEDPGR